MTAEEFAAHVGSRLMHVTPKANMCSIRKFGLMRAASIAEKTGQEARQLALRTDRQLLENSGGVSARLNHQQPLRAGRNKTGAFLEGHTLESWAEQLDRRIFFWPERRGAAFAKSFDGDDTSLYVDSAALFRTFPDNLFLSPINSGDATRKPPVRGDWIYVSATQSYKSFRENRRLRGLVKRPDTVKEISLTCDISDEILKTLIL